MMRNRIFSLLVLPALLCGCVDKGGDSSIEADPVPVTVHVSPLSSMESTRSVGPVSGWAQGSEVYIAYGTQPGALATSPTYTLALKGAVISGLTIFQPLLFYPPHPSPDYIYLKGFHPRNGVQDFEDTDETRVITDNKITYVITGQEDIMISNPLYGSIDVTIESKGQYGYLHYQHLLSWLSFSIQSDNAWPSTLKLKRISVTHLSNKAVLDLDKEHTDADALVFEAAHDKTLTAYLNPEGLEIPWETRSAPFANILIEPNSPFEVELELSSGDIITLTDIYKKNNSPLTINKAGDANLIRKGYHHDIELTFNSVGIAPEAITTNVILRDWATGEIVDGIKTGWW